MARAPVLSQERILAAAETLVQAEGPGALTLRRLGDALGVDNTALYRHFRNKDELLRMLADRILGDVVRPEQEALGWREAIRDICIRLREALLAQPEVGSLAQSGPSRETNELRLTEAVFAKLAEAGFSESEAAAVYHAVIELTVGAATIDGPISRLPAQERAALYATWQREYSALDPGQFPQLPRHASHMWLGDADARFESALDAMLEGFAVMHLRTT